jgi:uncharacterized protein
MISFELALICVAALAGAVASVCGFGIGSLLTPLLCLNFDPKIAVSLVAIPHFVGTAIRCWNHRSHINRHVLLSFGATSAAGGLIGACLHNSISSPLLLAFFGVILIFSGILGMTGWNKKLHFEGRWAWLAGAFSGAFGGLVGNQGGIRSAALLAFDLDKNAFVATATAVGLLVDFARIPIYLYSSFEDIRKAAPLLAVASLSVAFGTLAGTLILNKIPEQIFRRVVSAIILGLGIWILFQVTFH